MKITESLRSLRGPRGHAAPPPGPATPAEPGVSPIPPSVPSHYDVARKDCLGTAAGRTSKVWYTVAGGELSDVYAPTIDNTDVKSLDPIVTGPGFTALQPRDMSYTVAPLDGTGMACQVTARDAAHDFDLVTDFITDPSANAVVMRFTLVPGPSAPAGLRLYLRFNPLLNGHGGGGTGNAGGESATIVPTADGPVPLSYSTNSFTEAVNRSYARPVYAALAADRPFAAAETGFAGTSSDGLSELDSSGHSPRPRLTPATATWYRPSRSASALPSSGRCPPRCPRRVSRSPRRTRTSGQAGATTMPGSGRRGRSATSTPRRRVPIT